MSSGSTPPTVRPSSVTPGPAAAMGAPFRAPDAVDADSVAAAALSCPEVAGLSGGQFGEVATYLPGRRVTGVRITTDRVTVHVIARYGAPLAQIAARIRRTLAPTAAGLPVDVTFDDITAD